MQNMSRSIRLIAKMSCVLIIPGCMSSETSHTSYDIKAAFQVDNLVPVVIIGSGPAGLSAAVYTCRANLKTVVIEGEEPGGQLMKTSYVENWPGIKRTLGSSAVATVREQAVQFGASFLTDAVTRIDTSSWPFTITLQGGTVIRAMAIIVATGANPRYLGVPGEQQYWGSGVSACAICDAPFYKDEEVVVVGAGDAALEEAMQLAGYAKKVTLLVRKDHFRASATMQDHVKGYKNISVLFNVETLEVLGNGTFVTGVRLKNAKTGELSVYPTNGVFLGIGRIPSSQFLKGMLDMDQEGHIKLKGRSQETSVSGIFAAGDVADPIYRQAGVASGDGIKAALDAERFLTSIGMSREVAAKLEQKFLSKKDAGQAEDVLEAVHSMAELDKVISNAKMPVILDFFTAHCPSCLQLMPKLARAAHEFEGKVAIYKVDAENSFDIAQKYNVLRVPCLIVIKEGAEVSRLASDDEMKTLLTLEGIQLFLQQVTQP